MAAPKNPNPKIAGWRAKQKRIERGEEPPLTLDPPPAGAGRPFKDIDIEQIERLAMIQCTLEEIASCANIDIDTLRNNYSEIIEKGKKEGRKSLRRLQFEHAKKNAPMAMFLGKVYLDQVDNPQPQGPIKLIVERCDVDDTDDYV